MIIWTLERNKDREFYVKMGGVLTEKKTYPVANEELPMVGFVWEDIVKSELDYKNGGDGFSLIIN